MLSCSALLARGLDQIQAIHKAGFCTLLTDFDPCSPAPAPKAAAPSNPFGGFNPFAGYELSEFGYHS